MTRFLRLVQQRNHRKARTRESVDILSKQEERGLCPLVGNGAELVEEEFSSVVGSVGIRGARIGARSHVSEGIGFGAP